MPVAGDLLTPRLDVDPFGPDTAATLVVIDPREIRTVPPVRPEQGNAVWFGEQIRLIAGQYRLWWTTTGTGADQTTQYVDVDPAPGDTPDGFSYATTADLVAYTGKALPPDARRTLIAATREIDRLTKAAVYAVDDAGYAVHPVLRQALADATCELVSWWQATGTQSGVRGLLTAASIGGVSVSYNGNKTNPQADRVGPVVWTILLDANLLGTGSVLYG